MVELFVDIMIMLESVLQQKFRRDRNLNDRGVMIVTKDCYTITDLVPQTVPKMRLNWSGPS